MVMFDEVSGYQRVKDQMSSQEKSEHSAAIIEGFRKKGTIPGAYRNIWSIYERRLSSYLKRVKRDGAVNDGA